MLRTALGRRTSSTAILTAIKIAHTIIWGILAACAVAISVFAWCGNLPGAALAIGIVSIEVVVLVLNRLRCPLTAIAARYTRDRRANFDIYLPEWLARHTKAIFGTLYAGGIILTLARWQLAGP